MRNFIFLPAILAFSAHLNAGTSTKVPSADTIHHANTVSSTVTKITTSDEKARKAAAKIPERDFCIALGQAVRAARKSATPYSIAMNERARNEFNVAFNEISGIEQRNVAIGMSLCGVLAALGQASDVNRTVTRRGNEHFQLVYRAKRMYIYIDNDVVSGIQD